MILLSTSLKKFSQINYILLKNFIFCRFYGVYSRIFLKPPDILRNVSSFRTILKLVVDFFYFELMSLSVERCYINVMHSYDNVTKYNFFPSPSQLMHSTITVSYDFSWF